MKFRVTMLPEAEVNAAEIYHRIAAEAPLNADRWYAALCEAIESLDDMPRRCKVAPESSKFGREIRQLMHGVYRILFVIEDDEVLVIHIRHGARRYLEPDSDE